MGSIRLWFAATTILCACIAQSHASVVLSDGASKLQGSYGNVALSALGDDSAALDHDDAGRYSVATAGLPASVEYSSGTATFSHVDITAYFDSTKAASVSIVVRDALVSVLRTEDVLAALSPAKAGTTGSINAVQLPGSNWVRVLVQQGLEDLCHQVIRLEFTGAPWSDSPEGSPVAAQLHLLPRQKNPTSMGTCYRVCMEPGACWQHTLLLALGDLRPLLPRP